MHVPSHIVPERPSTLAVQLKRSNESVGDAEIPYIIFTTPLHAMLRTCTYMLPTLHCKPVQYLRIVDLLCTGAHKEKERLTTGITFRKWL